MTPRVTFLTDIVTPYTAAVFRALSEVCRLTVIYCARTGSRGLGWTFPERLPFHHHVLNSATVGRRTPDASDIYADPRILTTLARSRPDVTISGGFSVPSLYAAAYARWTSTRLLIHSDGTHDSEQRIGAAQRLLRRFFAHVADGAVANSVPAAERFLELGWRADRVFLAPHSTKVDGFHAVAERREYDDRTPVSVLSVTRLIRRKGVDRLIRSAAAARGRGADLRLLVAGTGPDAGTLRHQADDAGVPVEWLGLVEHDELPEVYAQADVFAFPTLMDPFGIALLEAAAAGLPLIASPHAGATHDFVRDGVNGIVVDPCSIDALGDAVYTLATDHELRRRLGENAYASTSDRTPEHTARCYLAAAEAALRR
jgi:glycosyltransferase involved in cell wall biosynthesis